jgi:hypothetical protein
MARYSRTVPATRTLLAALLLFATALATSSCRSGTVRLTFRPPAGADYTYDVTVRSVSEVDLGEGGPRRRVDETTLRAEHTVLVTGPGGVRVQVALHPPGSEPRTFVVRLDRAAQLEEIESIEGLPADVFGDLGLSEIFPAAAGAPPDRPLRPGDRWAIDDAVRLPGAEPVRLTGQGRLEKLGVVDGRDVATIKSTTRLPVQRVSESRDGRLELVGTQFTQSRTRHALADGAIDEAESVTRARFRVRLLPPTGVAGAPVEGTLAVEVISDVRRRH